MKGAVEVSLDDFELVADEIKRMVNAYIEMNKLEESLNSLIQHFLCENLGYNKVFLERGFCLTSINFFVIIVSSAFLYEINTVFMFFLFSIKIFEKFHITLILKK